MPIDIQHISKQFGPHRILDDVSLHIANGDSIAIVGPTGCGKSTLLNIISGLDTPNTGTVQIDDDILTSLSPNHLARIRANKIGFVFQSYYLQPHLTVLENVKIPSFVVQKFSPSQADERARKLLGAVGLLDKTDASPSTLSGGETQRVAIARALMNAPSYIFADEPTGSLDKDSAQNVIQILTKLQSDFGCTLLLVTHDPAIAAQMNHRITIVNGKVADAD